MVGNRAQAMKKRKEERERRYGPGVERKKGRARRFDDDYAAVEKDNDDKGLSSFRQRYERDDFGGARSFHVKGYIIGMVLIALFVLGLTRYARVADRRWNKGARIL